MNINTLQFLSQHSASSRLSKFWRVGGVNLRSACYLTGVILSIVTATRAQGEIAVSRSPTPFLSRASTKLAFHNLPLGISQIHVCKKENWSVFFPLNKAEMHEKEMSNARWPVRSDRMYRASLRAGSWSLIGSPSTFMHSQLRFQHLAFEKLDFIQLQQRTSFVEHL